MAKKSKKRPVLQTQFEGKFQKFHPQERVIFEILGQISPIMKAFSKGEKNNKYTV